MKTLLAGLTAALVLTAGSARAQAVSGPDLQDMQCFSLVAAQAGLAEGSPEAMAGLASLMMFYLGRLEGRSPDVDWLARIEAYIQTPEVEKLQTHAQRCSTEMAAKGKALTEWGARLSALAEQTKTQ